MPGITAIELGPDSCVFVRARPRAGAVEISAFHQIGRSAWPAHDNAVTAALRQVRRTRQLPRRARVVAWALSEPAKEGDALVRALVRPIAAAGFRVERVLTPPQALAELARTRPRGRGVAALWLAVNVNGAAIAIVRDGTLLFGRTFEWNFSADAAGPRAELLQRYSLVAHLAPEVRRGMALARSAHGAIVEVVVTCGDLPDLRSLTMPLIEELDLEVETLDSTEGLHPTRRALAEGFAEAAPALRLATAAATMPLSKGALAVRPIAGIAAAVVVVAALGWFGYRYWLAPLVDPAAGIAPARSEQARAAIPAPSASAPAPSSTTGDRPATPVDAPKPAPQATTPPPPPAQAVARAGLPPMDPAPPRADTSRRKPAPLTAPVPSVESILVASDRRVAVIDGHIVTMGDQVGSRVVAGIERDAVVLQEPSGYQIRIPIRRGRGVDQWM